MIKKPQYSLCPKTGWPESVAGHELFFSTLGEFCCKVFGGETCRPTVWLKCLPNCRAGEILNISAKS